MKENPEKINLFHETAEGVIQLILLEGDTTALLTVRGKDQDLTAEDLRTLADEFDKAARLTIKNERLKKSTE